MHFPLERSLFIRRNGYRFHPESKLLQREIAIELELLVKSNLFMPTPKRRNPRGYSGTLKTSHELKSLLPGFLQEMGEHFSPSSDKIIAYWEEMMGPDLAKFSRAYQFAGGVLSVKVLNNALYALLSKQEKPKLLKRLREAFPKLEIKTIEFRIG